jgi:hypothetical protein
MKATSPAAVTIAAIPYAIGEETRRASSSPAIVAKAALTAPHHVSKNFLI